MFSYLQRRKNAARRRVARVIVIGFAACIGLSLLTFSEDGRAEPGEEKLRLDLPAQDLSASLTQFGRASGTEIVFAPDAVRQKKAPALKGEFERDQALKMLLRGSGLTYRATAQGAIVVEPPKTIAEVPGLNVVQADDDSSSTPKAEKEGQNTEDSAASSPGRKLEEIVVTATKRAQNIQDVPMSISAITAEEIDRRGMVSAEDYLRGIPGANHVSNEIHGQFIIIRGLETTPTGSQNFGPGPTVATYFGETPTTHTAGLFGSAIDVKLVDIERVEVLRGPQGTAFGSSSLGGAVRTIPVAPKLDRIEGSVSASYSSTSGTGGDNYNGYGVVNFPLIEDKLALRAVGYRYENSGIYRNIAGSDPAVQARAAQFGAQAFATDADVGASRFTGGRVAALVQPSDALKLTLTYLKQKTESDGTAVASTGAYEQTNLQVAPEHVVRGETGGVNDTDIDLANATLEYDLGWGNLLGTYSYVEGGATSTVAFLSYGLGAASLLPGSYHLIAEHRAHSGELRLTTQLDGAWNFLGGLYAEDLSDLRDLNILWFGSPATNVFAPGQGFLGDWIERRTLKQKAAFAEVSWEFLPRFTLTGGVRAYDYDRTSQRDSIGPLLGDIQTERKAGTSGTSLRGNLSYKPSDSALIYAGWSEGFRLGRPQAGVVPALCDLDNDGFIDGSNVTIESTRNVQADDVDNYELGAKFTLLDRRLTIAADVYRIDWHNVPVRLTPTCGPQSYEANAGAARSEGIELQANIYVTETFRIDLGGSYMRAELTTDAPGLLPPAFAGDRLPGSPELTANLGLQYEFKIGDKPAFVRADPNYVGSFYGNLQETALAKAGGYLKLDVSAGVAFRGLDLGLFVRNLTDEDEFTWRDSNRTSEFFGFRLRPRTIGLQLTYNFD